MFCAAPLRQSGFARTLFRATDATPHVRRAGSSGRAGHPVSPRTCTANIAGAQGHAGQKPRGGGCIRRVGAVTVTAPRPLRVVSERMPYPGDSDTLRKRPGQAVRRPSERTGSGFPPEFRGFRAGNQSCPDSASREAGPHGRIRAPGDRDRRSAATARRRGRGTRRRSPGARRPAIWWPVRARS